MGAYYSHTKFFHFPEKLADLKAATQSAPIHIRIKPTNTCNHRCWYCGYQSDTGITLGEDLNTRDFIPQEKMVEIAQDLAEMEVKAVTFSGGGEPLTYRYFQTFFNRLHEGGVKVALLTNGALLAGSRAEVLADRASWVRVSMDGWNDDSYREYRGVKGLEFTRITENLAAFARVKGKTVLGVSLNVDIRNYPHIYDFVKHIKGLGVDHIKISGCVVSNDGKANNRYHAPFFEETDTIIKRAAADFQDERFRVVNAYHGMPERFAKNYESCPFSRLLTVIAADLNVYTCQDKAYTASGLLGSIKNIRFRDFWMGETCTRALAAVNPKKHCEHHCVADRKNRALFEYLSARADHLEFV